MKYLLAGLGNIGKDYENTRHNIGFQIVDEISNSLKSDFIIEKYALLSSVKYKSRHLYLLKPTLYMNSSGKSVKYWKDKLNIPLENLLIITDDIHLPFGAVRLKAKGSTGGHNGLKDIEIELCTNYYTRLKIGIGNDFNPRKQNDYVLGKFTEKEKNDLGLIIHKAKEAALSFVFHGTGYTMNNFN